MKRTKAYKAFDENLQCRGVQYYVGDIFVEDSPEIIPCRSGIHCCLKLKDVFNYYEASESTRVCEIVVIGEYVEEGDKLACREIEIVRELNADEIAQATDGFKFNSGNYNSGYRNSGDRNSGDRNSGNYNSGNYNSGNYNSEDYNSGNYNSGYRNSGYRNSGNYNSGDYNSGNYNSEDYNSGNYNSGYRNSGDRNSGNYNSGDYNSGNYNSGDYNSGDYNSGNYNSGNYNSGNYNSGNYNSGNYNSGFFNSTEATVRLFNIDTGKLRSELPELSKINSIMYNYWKEHLTWVHESSMTDKEKEDNPSYKTTCGYLKQDEYNYKKSWTKVWDKCSIEEKQVFLDLPNFDVKVFEEITGIKIKTNLFGKPVLD